mmetsp:Transcript_28333/g.52865  ORF Transcript_28333/g.52865 Transcript_28333/m.52865 type:complete len:272 (-) Transcript_28333:2007-2822(-)
MWRPSQRGGTAHPPAAQRGLCPARRTLSRACPPPACARRPSPYQRARKQHSAAHLAISEWGAGSCLFAGALALHLDHLAGDHLPLERFEVVDEQLAIEVVNLVLNAGGPEAVHLFTLFIAVAVDPFDLNLSGPGHVGILLGQGQTALLIDVQIVRGGHNLGVEHDQGPGRLALFLDAIEHDQTLQHAHLRGGQTHTRRVIHGFQHIIGQRAQVIRQIGDGIAGLFQTRVGVQDNRAFHGVHLSEGGARCNVPLHLGRTRVACPATPVRRVA